MIKKVIKGLSGFLIALLIFSLFPTVPQASAAGRYGIFDLADKLSDADEQLLLPRAKTATQQTGMNICVVIIDNLRGKTYTEYADDFYDDEYGINTDGILLLINLDTGYDWISTSGEAMKYYSDARIDSMFDQMESAMKSYDVYSEARIFFEQCVKYYNEGIPDDHYIYDEYTGEIIWEADKPYNFSFLFTGFCFSLFMGVLALVSIIAKYKSHAKVSAINYTSKDNTHFTVKSDHFIREYTTKTRIETNSGSSRSGGGGGSRSRTSSSGGRHGGGGRGR